MVTLADPSVRDRILAAHVYNTTRFLGGTAGYGQLVKLIALDDSTNYANTLGNIDTTNGRALKVQYGPIATPTTIALFAKAGITLSVPVTFSSTVTFAGAITSGGGLILPWIATPSNPAASFTTLFAQLTTGKLARLAPSGSAIRMMDVNAISAVGSTSSPTITSSSYGDLDEMSVTRTTTGGDLEVDFSGVFNHTTAGQSVTIGLSLDGAAEVAERAVNGPVNNYGFMISTSHIFTSVAAGEHTVKARWKTSGATAGALGTNRSIKMKEL